MNIILSFNNDKILKSIRGTLFRHILNSILSTSSIQYHFMLLTFGTQYNAFFFIIQGLLHMIEISLLTSG